MTVAECATERRGTDDMAPIWIPDWNTTMIVPPKGKLST